MAEHYQLMAPGARPGATPVQVRAPYDGKLIATVDVAGGAAVEQALTTAYALFQDRTSWLSPAVRIKILRKAARLMETRAEHLALEAAREGGKPLVDSRVEVARAIDGVLNCAELLRSEAGRTIPMGINAASANRFAFTTHEPIGVVVAMSAFNHPLNLIVHQVGPAIAAGCPVIVKPAEAAPLSCFRFVAILREAGLPEAWCQAFLTESREISSHLVSDSRIGLFSFVGSAEVGWKLRSRLAPGTRCTLEHGGAAPVIVAADADLHQALPKLVKGSFYHAGQVCVSVQRIYAHNSIIGKLVAGLARQAGHLKIGDPTLPDTDVGPLIRQKEVMRVHEWVSEAMTKGAGLVCGGKVLSSSCYAPTVLFEPPKNCNVSTREIFGPVVCVYGYDNLDDAINAANSLPYAFQSAVFTRDMATAMRCYDRLDASAVMLNDHTAFRVDWMPFAGLRHSGLGVGGIPYTFKDMQIEKMFVGMFPSDSNQSMKGTTST